MSIGAIVVTHNNPASSVRRCLESLKSNNIGKVSIINNDDNNNPGFAAAANHGANQMDDEYLLFINPDAYLKDNFSRPVIEHFSENKKVGIIGALLTSPDGKPEMSSFGPTVTPASLFTRHWEKPTQPKDVTTVGWVSGGAMIVRRELFWQLGGFDPQFFLYWEDVDLCRRAKQSGWRVDLNPSIRAIHSRGESSNDEYIKTKIYDQSADKYFHKHYSTTICLALRSARFLYRLSSPLAV